MESLLGYIVILLMIATIGLICLFRSQVRTVDELHRQLDSSVEQRKQLTKALDVVLDSIPVGILVLDNQDCIMQWYFNDGKKKRLRARHCIGQSVYKVFPLLMTQSLREPLKTILSKVRSTGMPQEVPRFSYLTRNGMTEYYRIKVFPAYHEMQIKGLILLFLNITQESLIEEEFLQVTEEKEKTNRELSVALSNLDFYLMDLEQANKKLAALYKITSIVQNSTDLGEVLDKILERVEAELGFKHCCIYIADEQGQTFIPNVRRNLSGRQSRTLTLGEGIPGKAAESRELIFVADIRENGDGQLDDGIVSEVAVPLIVHERIVGIMDVQSTKEKNLLEFDKDMLRSLASQIAMTIEHAQQDTKVHCQAITDGLTGLYNQRRFREQLSIEIKRAQRYNHKVSLLMLDVDCFKCYNDTYGHPQGDVVLKTVARLMLQTCREVDFVARYGGEEFIIILPETGSKESYKIAERIRHAIEVYPFPGQHTQPGSNLTVSIGCATFPIHGTEEQQLVERADHALYQAKRQNKNQVCVYNQAYQSK